MFGFVRQKLNEHSRLMKLQEQDFKFNDQSTPFLNNPRIPQIHTLASSTVIYIHVNILT